jgi:hypothetical protein
MTICPSCRAENEAGAEACFTCGKALSSLVKGAVIASRYEILSPLGKGGMGVVYKAYDRELEETVALKVLRADLGGSEEMARRFRSEIKLARKVRHRNICGIHEYGQEGPLLFIAMELIEGLDLKRILTGHGALPPGQAYDVATQVADGLQAIHDEGIIHRDLKTTNIMVDKRGVVRLMDFGIAKEWQAEGAAGLTGTGQIVGTPEYMSPEQVRAQKIDFRSDIYSLGVVVFELFTGHVPFRGATPAGIIFKHLEEAPPLDGASAVGLPKEVIPILRKALAKDPAERYPKARLMAQALREAEARTRPEAATTAVPLQTATMVRPSAPLPVTSVATEVRTSVPTDLAGGPRAAATARVRPPAVAALVLTASALVVAGVVAYRRSSAARAIPSTPTAAQPAVTAPPPAGTVPATLPPATAAAEASDAPPAKVPESRTPAALSQDPGNVEAQRILARVKAAQEAELQVEKRRQASAQINDLLDRAEKAIVAGKPEVAIGLYDEVLKLDRENQVARMGRLTAINSRAAAQTGNGPAPPAAAGKSFTSGKTQAVSAETRAVDAAPPGFEPGSGIAVSRSTQPAALPGLILFEVAPEAVKPGDRYQVKVVFVNGGPAPIEIRTMSVATLTNVGRSGGPVAPLTKVVAPRARALLLSPEGVWKDDVASWSMEVAVHTAAGETYRNTLAWK